MKSSKRQVEKVGKEELVARPPSQLRNLDSRGCDPPPGTPAWISRDLLALTLKVWQPYYKEPLSAQDAVTIVLNVGKLIGVLCRE